MLEMLRPGDVVAVTRLDRLARSTRDLLDIAERLDAAEAGLRSLAEPWADTTSPAGRMVLTIFAGIAEFERSLIHERTSSGRAAAMATMSSSIWRKRNATSGSHSCASRSRSARGAPTCASPIS